MVPQSRGASIGIREHIASLNGVSQRPHTLHRALSESANSPDSLVGRQGLEPWALGLKERASEFT